MLASRVVSRASRSLFTQYCQSSLIHSSSQNQQLSILTNPFHSLSESPNKFVTSEASLLQHSTLNSYAFQRVGISSSASPKPTKKGTIPPVKEHRSTIESPKDTKKGTFRPLKVHRITIEKNGASTNTKSATTRDAKVSIQTKDLGSGKTKVPPHQTKESYSSKKIQPFITQTGKRKREKEKCLKLKSKETEGKHDKVPRNKEKMENHKHKRIKELKCASRTFIIAMYLCTAAFVSKFYFLIEVIVGMLY